MDTSILTQKQQQKQFGVAIWSGLTWAKQQILEFECVSFSAVLVVWHNNGGTFAMWWAWFEHVLFHYESSMHWWEVIPFCNTLPNCRWNTKAFLHECSRTDIAIFNVKDKAFLQTQQVGIGVEKKQAQALSESQEEELWEKGIFIMNSNEGLVNAIFWYNSKVFPSSQWRQAPWSDWTALNVEWQNWKISAVHWYM